MGSAIFSFCFILKGSQQKCQKTVQLPEKNVEFMGKFLLILYFLFGDWFLEIASNATQVITVFFFHLVDMISVLAWCGV